MTGMMVRRPTK